MRDLCRFLQPSLIFYTRFEEKLGYNSQCLEAVPDLGQGLQSPSPWAQLTEGTQCTKTIDEFHVAISFSKPWRLRQIQRLSKNFYVTLQETIQILLVLAHVFRSLLTSAAIVSVLQSELLATSKTCTRTLHPDP